MSTQFVGTGPCGSQILTGYPRSGTRTGQTFVEYKFVVPGDMMCCFSRHIFGEWVCTSDGCLSVSQIQTDPLSCCTSSWTNGKVEWQSDVGYDQGFQVCHMGQGWISTAIILAGEDPPGVSAFWDPDPSYECPTDATTAGILLPVDIQWDHYGNTYVETESDSTDAVPLCKGGSVAPMFATVQYEPCQISVDSEFVALEGDLTFVDEEDFPETISDPEEEPRLTVGYPTCIKVVKRSGTQVRKVKTPGVKFCSGNNACGSEGEDAGAPLSMVTLDLTTGQLIGGSPIAADARCDNYQFSVTINDTMESSYNVLVNVAGTLVQTLTSPGTYGPFKFNKGDYVEVVNGDTEDVQIAPIDVEFADNTSCCKEAPPDATEGVIISSDQVQVTWSGVPADCWNRKLAKSLKGKANSKAFLGYPAYGLVFEGYSYNTRMNWQCQVVADIVFSFIGSTAPANGETVEYTAAPKGPGYGGAFIEDNETLNGVVGLHGRSWCDIPINGTGQNWQFLCKPDGSPFVEGTPLFEDMFEIEMCMEEL